MPQNRCCLILIAFLTASAMGLPAAEKQDCAEDPDYKPCAHPIVNGNCKVVIERNGPVAPVPIRLKEKANACIVIAKKPAESILFEAEFKDSLPPDPFVTIFISLNPSLRPFVASVTISVGALSTATDPKYPPIIDAGIENTLIGIDRALESLYGDQDMILSKLNENKKEAARFEDLLLNMRRAENLKAYADAKLLLCKEDKKCELKVPLASTRIVEQKLKSLVEDFALVLSKVQTAVRTAEAKKLQGDEINAIDFNKKELTTKNGKKQALSAESLAVLKEVERISDGIAAMDQNTRELQKFRNAIEESVDGVNKLFSLLPDPAKAKDQASYVLLSAVDQKNITALGVSRAASLKISARDIGGSEKKLLTTVSVSWGAATRWELSSGLLFSNLKARTFANALQFSNPSAGAPQYRVTESVTTPAIVPAALVHYRLWETGAKKRFALLATAGAGVNTAAASADLVGGISFSIRNFVLSFLAHRTRDLRLTNGYFVGMPLTSPSPSPTTERYWVTKGSIGISYRIPIP